MKEIIKRRQFLGYVISGTTATLIRPSFYPDLFAEESYRERIEFTYDNLVPSWVKRGQLRWVWGLWEPLLHYKRSDYYQAYAVGNHYWTDEYYERMHSEEIVSKLAKMGVNLITTAWFKGYGMKAESAETNLAIKFTELCHKYGIRVLGYIQWGTIVYETFLEEVPHAQNWIQITKEGDLHLYSESQYWRWVACPLRSKGEHTEYLKSAIKRALTEANMDGIEWDGTRYLCHCDVCQEEFRNFLKKKYKKPEDVFGLPTFDYVRIPPNENPRDPLYQELKKFRYQVLNNSLRDFYLYVKNINPEAAVVMYPVWPAPEPSPYVSDMLIDESHEAPYVENGKIYSRISKMKRGNSVDRIVINTSWRRTSDGILRRPETSNEVKLDLAECGAYGGNVISATWALRSPGPEDVPWAINTPGPGDSAYFEQRHIKEPMEQYMKFFKAHEALYDNNINKPITNIAIYESFYGNSNTEKIIQYLLKHQIPFDYVYNNNINQIYKYDLLVLADLDAMSQGEIDEVTKFVNRGGALLATGRSSLFDERYRRRKDYGLSKLFNHNFVKYLKDLENENEVIDTIFKIISTPPPVSVSASPYIVVDTYKLQSGIKTVHLINYNNENPISNVLVQFGPQFKSFGKILYYSPDDGSEGIELNVENREIVIPKLYTYGVLVIH